MDREQLGGMGNPNFLAGNNHTCLAQCHTKLYPTRNPELQLRINSNDIDRIVMAISSLSYPIHKLVRVSKNLVKLNKELMKASSRL